MPQALSAPPMLQTSFGSQQPVHAEQLGPQPPPSSACHRPTLQVSPALVQSVHEAPWMPQAVSAPPILQMLFAQQPVHHAEQLPPLPLEPALLPWPPLLLGTPCEPLLDPPLDVPFSPLDPPLPLLEFASSRATASSRTPRRAIA